MRALTKRGAARAGLVAAVLLAHAGWLPADGQVTGLEVWHRAGQTFITFREVRPPEVPTEPTNGQIRDLRRKLSEGTDALRYRIYRSPEPIAAAGLAKAERIAEIAPLTGWNVEFSGRGKWKAAARRYVVREGQDPLPHGVGIYVHNPARAGKAYYAVTCATGGRESPAVTQANSAGPVEEAVGQGEPVLQRIEKPAKGFKGVKGCELHFYVRWEAPPNCNRAGRPIDYVVGVPPNKPKDRPAPVSIWLHCWGANLLTVYGWGYKVHEGAVLISSNQFPYDWWTGYHEYYGLKPFNRAEWSKGVVRPYSTRRTLSFLDWATKKYNLDTTRVHVAGNSMGGSGTPMLAIRYPDRIAWACGWVGVHDPGNSPGFTNSYERVYGRKAWGVKFADGTNVWDYYKDAWYLRRHPDKEIGFISWSNGKNDGGIGWPQAVEFYKAMQETRRPHLFLWGLSAHGQRPALPGTGRGLRIDIRTDLSLPAFTGCSLDDDPGTATKRPEPKSVEFRPGKFRKDPYDGDSIGQVNRYLYWWTEDIVDTETRWGVTVGLIESAPKDACTVRVTPRRLQKLKVRPGERLTWTNRSVAGGEVVQTGSAEADKWGLVTLEGIKVTKGKNRLELRRKSAAN